MNPVFSRLFPAVTVVFAALVSALLLGAEEIGSPQAAVLRRFEDKYHAATRLEATFLERYSENGRLVRMEAGKAYFQRPGKMRWDYEAPEPNTFLVDGKYVWFFSPADRTATRMPAKSSEDWRTPFAFLTTGMKLSRICSKVGPASNGKPARPEDEVFRCVLRGADTSSPKNTQAESLDPGSQSPHVVFFELSPQAELVRIVVHDQAGIEIEFSFKDWQWNPALSKSLFQFNPPAGVAIVNGAPQ